MKSTTTFPHGQNAGRMVGLPTSLLGLFLARAAATAEASCQDTWEDVPGESCSSWAAAGECEANAAFMLAKCQLSCGCKVPPAQTLGWGESIINTSHPWYIVSTSGSRMPNEGLYLPACCFTSLEGWEFDYNNPDNKMAFWLWPAGDEADLFYLVGTKDSRMPGYMLVLGTESEGNVVTESPDLYPFHPDKRDSQAQWKLIPAARGVVESPDDMPAYFIVSGPNQHAPNKMLYVGAKPFGAKTLPRRHCF